MAVRFHVRFDLRSFERAMSDVADRQTPFATALALTWTAQDAQDVLRGGLERHFTIRDRWTARGIRIEPAKKRQLSAAVGSVDSYMALQVEGGTKMAWRSADLAVPLWIRKHPKQRTGRSRWPGALLQKPGHFVAPLPGGGKRLAVYRRRTKKRLPLDVLYVFHRQVRVTPRCPSSIATWDHPAHKRIVLHVIEGLEGLGGVLAPHGGVAVVQSRSWWPGAPTKPLIRGQRRS
jgi:hypothetical protein